MRLSAIVLAFLLAIPANVTAQTEEKLVASDAAASDRFGATVAISANTAVVGALKDDDAGIGSGSAYVFTRTAGIWSEQAKLTAADAELGDSFGYSAAIDGDTAVVGAYGDNDGGGNSGAAYVFTGGPVPVELQRFAVE